MPLANRDRLSTSSNQPSTGNANQPANIRLVQRSGLDSEQQEFIIDRQAHNLTPKTIRWYEQSLAHCRFTTRYVGKNRYRRLRPQAGCPCTSQMQGWTPDQLVYFLLSVTVTSGCLASPSANVASKPPPGSTMYSAINVTDMVSLTGLPLLMGCSKSL